jgi:hypothetical protein
MLAFFIANVCPNIPRKKISAQNTTFTSVSAARPSATCHTWVLPWLLSSADGRAALTEVKVVGISENDVLVEGLTPGQTVITAGVHVLTQGQAVSPLPAPIPAAQAPARLSAQALMAPAADPNKSAGAVNQ